MKRKTCWLVFGLLTALFVVAISPLHTLLGLGSDFRDFVPYLGALGGLLVVSTAVSKTGKWPKIFLIITGASAMGFAVGLYVHDPLLKLIPGEPFTYVLVFYISPIGFIAGAVGSIISGIKQLASHR